METPEVLENIKGSGRKRRKFTAQEKWQIFLETSIRNAPVGGILRRYGLYSSELTRIRRQAETGALKELGGNRNCKKIQTVSYKDYAKLEAELSAKEKALAQMGEEYLLSRKFAFGK